MKGPRILDLCAVCGGSLAPVQNISTAHLGTKALEQFLCSGKGNPSILDLLDKGGRLSAMDIMPLESSEYYLCV